jgi:DNA modification methylase
LKLKAFSEAKLLSDVGFRERLDCLNEKDRLSHHIHRYPAKMIYHIPYFFLHDDQFCSKEDIVLDSFCGSGTVLVESVLANRECIGADLNPLCCLITKVKTTPLDKREIDNATKKLFKKLETKANLCNTVFPNVDYWFTRNAQKSLAWIKWSIEECEFDHSLKDFFLVCFSSIIRESSRADPRIGPPVLSKEMRTAIGEGRRTYPEKLFREAVRKNRDRILEFSSRCPTDACAHVLFQDAKYLSLKDDSVDFVITSPPYMNAQKYFRSTRLELFWLGLASEKRFACLDSYAIGTERIKTSEYPHLRKTGIHEVDEKLEKIFEDNPSRASEVAKYFVDLDHAVKEISRILETGKLFVLIVGDNKVRGMRFPSHDIVVKIAEEWGFSLSGMVNDKIKSHGLMTKRNKTSGLIDSEWILVFRKEW